MVIEFLALVDIWSCLEMASLITTKGEEKSEVAYLAMISN